MNKAELTEKVAKMSLNLKVNEWSLKAIINSMGKARKNSTVEKDVKKIKQTRSLCELIAGEQGDNLR